MLVDGRQPVEVRVALTLEVGDRIVPVGDVDHPVRRAERIVLEGHAGGSIRGLNSDVVERS